ncbi:hypothetical protein DID76_03695 [Candidatus Marinamargulisbacteria bacterium SCGC AG-414-C22]|nr:hypothetical protein DID76_03695 [Candidatus Marinamargulisbacteria bacterium SCGC AG-414-C22]
MLKVRLLELLLTKSSTERVTFFQDETANNKHEIKTDIENIVIEQAIQIIAALYQQKDKQKAHEFLTTLQHYHHVDVKQIMDFPTITNEDTKNAKFIFGSEVVDYHNFEELNQILLLSGSKLMIQCGIHGTDKELLIGYADYESYDDYHVYFMYQEIGFSPNIILPMAAMINQQTILVRSFSIKNIVSYKWTNELLGFSGLSGLNTLADICSNKLKQRAITILKDNEDALADVEKNVMHNVTFHELGHAVIQYHVLDPECAAFAEAFQIVPDSIVECLLEVLADLAPSRGKKSGVFMAISEKSTTQLEEAKALFWTYLSDAWFYDTDLDYMYTYSDCLCGLMTRYCDNSNTINFNALKSDMNGENTKGLVNKLVGELNKIVNKIKDVLQIDYDDTTLAKKDKVDIKTYYQCLAKDAENKLKTCLKTNEDELKKILEKQKSEFFKTFLPTLTPKIKKADNQKEYRKNVLTWFKCYLD